MSENTLINLLQALDRLKTQLGALRPLAAIISTIGGKAISISSCKTRSPLKTPLATPITASFLPLAHPLTDPQGWRTRPYFPHSA